MKLSNIQTFLIFLIITTFSTLNSCKDIVEPDISSKSVNVNTPANGYQSSSSTITFWWNEVESAFGYKLQVVKPGFASIQTLVLDTSVESDKFTYSFQPGSYEWRIKAVNGSSETEFTTLAFSIDSTLDLSNQVMSLIAPVNSIMSNSSLQHFQWYTIASAEDYRFEILSSSGSVIYSNASYPLDSISYTFTTDGNYKWRVRAQNSNSVSAYSEYNLSIDRIAPMASSPSSPADASNVSNPVALSWLSDASAIADSLFVNVDSLYTGANFYKGYLTATTYTITGTVGQKYFWRLRSKDAAGNWSGYSSSLKFKVQ
jgi:predicted secreted protein